MELPAQTMAQLRSSSDVEIFPSAHAITSRLLPVKSSAPATTTRIDPNANATPVVITQPAARFNIGRKTGHVRMAYNRYLCPLPDMKQALLIILLIVFPWQAIAAAERNLAHVMSGGDLYTMGRHMAEHEAHVLHHHDDDDGGGAPHIDKSDKSVQHLNDYEHGGGLHVLLPAPPALSAIALPRFAPVPRPENYSDRTTLPPLPPPRARA